MEYCREVLQVGWVEAEEMDLGVRDKVAVAVDRMVGFLIVK